MGFIESLAEEKIQQALRDGAFDNLPGKGRPLEMEQLSSVPADLRIGYKVLKNAGYLPQELQLHKEIVTLGDLLRCCTDDGERKQLTRRLNEKKLRFNQLMEKRNLNRRGIFQRYRRRIVGKLHL
ncbi:MAG: DUF1992 domain-containing protein [Sporolactobacillus sp.]|nr:DUF1992 domain-containing protein [Sporolactobacillus sp.]